MKDLFELSVELDGVSASVYALQAHFDGERIISDKMVSDMLYSIREHIDRINNDLRALDKH